MYFLQQFYKTRNNTTNFKGIFICIHVFIQFVCINHEFNQQILLEIETYIVLINYLQKFIFTLIMYVSFKKLCMYNNA